MVSRIPWDEKETVLLIDTCVSIKNKEISRDEAVKGLSRTLKMRAEYIGLEIDDMFRNENGISMQLSLIERLMDESESGFNHYSRMFVNMVNLYKKSPAQFEEILIKAKDEECKSVQKAFYDWLSTRVSTSMLSLYKNTRIDLESFCSDNKILSESIFKITNLDDINNLVSKIENKIKFSYKYLNKADKFLKLVNYYIEFIKETSLYGESSVVIDESSKEEKDIVSFIEAEKISYSDERIKNGPVWIFGGIEAKQFVAKMKDKGVAFVFGYCGGVAGWWTRNYNVKILVEEDTAEVCPDVVEEDTAEVCPDVVDEDTAEVCPDVVDEDTAEVCPDVVNNESLKNLDMDREEIRNLFIKEFPLEMASSEIVNKFESMKETSLKKALRIEYCDLLIDLITKNYVSYDADIKKYSDNYFVKSYVKNVVNLNSKEYLYWAFYYFLIADYEKCKENVHLLLQGNCFKEVAFGEADLVALLLSPFKNAFEGFWDFIASELKYINVEDGIVEFCYVIDKYYRSRNNDEVAEVLIEFTRKYPEVSIANEFLGFIYYSMKMWNNAIAYLERIDNSMFFYQDEIFWMLAWSYGKVKNYTEEETYYRKCLDVYSNREFLLNNLGYCLFKQKRFEDARICFEECLKKNIDLPNAANNFISVLIATGKYADAKKFVEDEKYKIDKSLKAKVEKLPNENISITVKEKCEEEALSENKTFAEIYNLKPADYDYIDVQSAKFSVRVEKRLIRNDINSIGELLKVCPSTIKSFDGIGDNSIKEIGDFFDKIKTSGVDFVSKVVSQELIDETKVTFNENLIIIPEEINDIFGDELVEEFRNNESRCILINYLKLMNEDLICARKITEAIRRIPEERLTLKTYGFILAYNCDDNIREILLSLLDDKQEMLSDYLNKLTYKIVINELSLSLINFIHWLSFDLKDDIDSFFESLYAKDRIDRILILRANNHTLEEVGNELGITRERVRQIESKVSKNFRILNNKYCLLRKIYAIRNGDTVLTVDEINSYLGEYSDVFLYLIKKFNYSDIAYNKKLDVFIIADDTLDERVIEYVEQLPDVFSLEELEMFYDYAEKDLNINSEILGQTISEYYNLFGSTYSRKNLNRYDLLIDCIGKYFPKGIRVGDANQINELREIASEHFGDLNFSDNNRAIAARIMDKCILVDRGTYLPKRERYISEELAQKIYNYINDSKHTVIYILSLFIKFKKDLIKEGIGNRYFLHGILKELYQKDFYFRRDCLSKDSLFVDPYGRETSALKELCLNVIDFIGQKKYPVLKKEIYDAFPDISEFIMYNVISSKEVVNYSGSYLHIDHIKFYEDEYLRVKSIISEVVSDDKVHHISEIFNIVNRQIPEFLTRNFALNPFGCSSLLNHVYNGEFNFSRPYVSKLGVEIASVTQRLHEFVYSNDVIKITEINNFAKENSYNIPSMMQYLKSCNDEFLLISHNEMMKIDKTGITKDIAMTIEDILCEEVTKTLPIYELTSLYKLPRIAVPWNEWLLFSIINKWGSKLSVATTSNQFRHAVPIIAPVGEVDEELYKDLTRSNVGDTLVETDIIDSLDSDDMDDLLENLLDDIWEDDL